MRLANGIVVDNDKTFGELKFSGLRRTSFVLDSDGKPTEEVKDRTYDLKCRKQGDMISVKIPANVPEKTFGYNDKVVLAKPVVDTVAGYGVNGSEANWYIRADDILLSEKVIKPSQPAQKATDSKENK